MLLRLRIAFRYLAAELVSLPNFRQEPQIRLYKMRQDFLKIYAAVAYL